MQQKKYIGGTSSWWLRIYFVLLTAKQGSWLQAITFLCPELTHPHGAELREVSMSDLTVNSGMQSVHICGIPKDDVLCFWPEILVHSPESQHKPWPSLFCLPFCRVLYDIPKCSSIPRTSSSSPWQQHLSWALWNPLPLRNSNPCLAPFQLPESVRPLHPVSSKDWLYAQTCLDHKTLTVYCILAK